MTAIEPAWRKSGRSDSNGNCVEIRDNYGRVEVRDSKNPTGPVLRFNHGTFAIFIRDVKAGRFGPWEIIGLYTGDEWDRLTGAWDRVRG